MTNILWKHHATPASLNQFGTSSMSGFLGIEITQVGPDYLVATMPVNEKNVQPFGILHGGASVVLAETLGSVASTLCIENHATHTAVGVEVNANHLKSIPAGQQVTATCRPLRIGRQMHVWQIDLCNAEGELTCVSRLTVMVVERKGRKEEN